MTSTRGDLTISAKVIEKTASRILTESGVVGGARDGVFGFGADTSTTARPSVTAHLSGRSCALEVRLGLRYPTPIAETTEDIRERLRTGVETLIGVAVRQIDIRVATMLSHHDRSGRMWLI